MDAAGSRTSAGGSLASNDGAGLYCDCLEALALGRSRLRSAAMSAYRHYRDKLNWRQSMAHFTNALVSRIQSRVSHYGSQLP